MGSPPIIEENRGEGLDGVSEEEELGEEKGDEIWVKM